MYVQVGEHKLVTASEDFTVCVWYTKTTHPKVCYYIRLIACSWHHAEKMCCFLCSQDEETDKLDPAFVEIPVVQVTTH